MSNLDINSFCKSEIFFLAAWAFKSSKDDILLSFSDLINLGEVKTASTESMN